MESPTIAAIATPAGSGGIGIIKLSGPEAIKIASTIFRPKKNQKDSSGKTDVTLFKSHRLYHGYIVNSSHNQVIDEVLLTIMNAPFSYTKEDVVEINAHAGAFVLNAILDLVLQHGAVLASPGEFTKRAFLNGRIDLTQAEAVIDIINAKTESALNMAAAQITGGLSKKIKKIQKHLIDILTELEAAIDFPDETDDIINTDKTTAELEDMILGPLEEMVRQYETSRYLRDGVKIVIAGKPNVGKSTLMNVLVDSDRSIVTPIPGTTRDLVEETFILNGICVSITDTAGIHETDDPVEKIGIDKARKDAGLSDLVLFIIDGSKDIEKEDKDLYKQLDEKQRILIINKLDLAGDFRPCFPKEWERLKSAEISALYKTGINHLKTLIGDVIVGKAQETIKEAVPGLRHKMALEESLTSLSSAIEGLREVTTPELTAIDIKEAITALGKAIGDPSRIDILDSIFSRFCIGK